MKRKEKVMLSVEVSYDLRKRFREALARKDKTAREVMPELIGQWINRNGG